MLAKDFLRQVEMLDVRICNKLIECRLWRDKALSITASVGGEKVQSSGNSQKMETAIIKCIDMESEIDALVDELIDTKRKVISTIERLDSPTEYDILHKRYIQGLTLQEIADEKGRDYTTITTTHGRALKNVQVLLDKGVKNETDKS
jgi:hypothetical protein